MQHKTTVKYSKTTNRVRIHTSSKEIYPQYLKYLFEYLKIPDTAKIVFDDRTIKGGLKEFLQE